MVSLWTQGGTPRTHAQILETERRGEEKRQAIHNNLVHGIEVEIHKELASEDPPDAYSDLMRKVVPALPHLLILSLRAPVVPSVSALVTLFHCARESIAT
jgi:hypothetical protein